MIQDLTCDECRKICNVIITNIPEVLIMSGSTFKDTMYVIKYSAILEFYMVDHEQK